MKNKINDPVLKEDAKKFGDNIAKKSKEITEKGVDAAKKGYLSFKKVIINIFIIYLFYEGMMSAFNYISDKTHTKSTDKSPTYEQEKKINQNVEQEKNLGNKENLNKSEDYKEKQNEKKENIIDYQEYFQTYEEKKPDNNNEYEEKTSSFNENVNQQNAKGDMLIEPIKPTKTFYPHTNFFIYFFL